MYSHQYTGIEKTPNSSTSSSRMTRRSSGTAGLRKMSTAQTAMSARITSMVRTCTMNSSNRRGSFVLPDAVQAGSGRRDCTIRKRGATNAASVRVALHAGFAPVPWKSENAEDWLT